ncbi:MAG: PduL/EutD family phosphate acyltransferase [Patescibacteria group bacterium]|jgi:propanediol utilization protein
MSRPIPIDVVPSHVYLSAEDQATLFGIGHPMTIHAPHTQSGQLVYEETVEVLGTHKRSLHLRVMGPNWKESHIELTALEADYLGIDAPESPSGDLLMAGSCTLRGPHGELKLAHGAIIPTAHLFCSPDEAQSLGIHQGETIAIETVEEPGQTIEGVTVRVHPTYRLRVEIREDVASRLWISRSAHARLRFSSGLCTI